MLFKKSVFKSLTAALIGISLLNSVALAAVPQCVDLFKETQVVEFKINTIDKIDQIRLSANALTKIKSELSQLNLTSDSTNIKDLIEVVAGHLNVKRTTSTEEITSAIEKSNAMAEVGTKILDIVKGELTKKQYKSIQYTVAESVLRLESIEIKKFKKTKPQVFKDNPDSILRMDQFLDYVEHYVDGSKKYTDDIPAGGFLDWPGIRDLYANNSWIIGIKDHDMYHLHYSYGHPYYLAVNMMASRTVNDRRYILTSALWEAVDDFRSTLESSISKYYSKKGMTAEQGMLDLGTASEAKLEKIVQEIYGIDYVDGGIMYSTKAWRPAAHKFGRATAPKDHSVYVDEINSFVNDALKRSNKPANSKYRKYHRNGPGQTINRSEEAIPGLEY